MPTNRPPRSIGETLLTWLASLRVRLIVTYVLVTLISFGIVLLQLMAPVSRFVVDREENMLRGVATTLGSTISAPWDDYTTRAREDDNYRSDMFWTQRRCRLYLKIPNLRVRILDSNGQVLVDSSQPVTTSDQWSQWWTRNRLTQPALTDRQEVREAMAGAQSLAQGSRESLPSAADASQPVASPHAIYVAEPIYKLYRDPAKRTEQQRLAFIMYLDRPMDVIASNMLEMQRRLNVSLLTSLLVTVLVSIFLARNLSAGLRSATRIATSFAAGNTSQRMRETGRDEVGQLGAAFNRMADALERQEHLRRDLLADVSHELRTPLTAIAGCADTLADGTLYEDPAAAERFLHIILRESERMQRLVADILELSKLQAGAVEFRRAPLAVAPLIDDAVEIARLQAGQEGVCITWAPPADAVALLALGNEDRLAQALRNLLDNARHHTPVGRGIFVTLNATPDEIVIHVRDEGDGIPEADLPWVFDRFYRAGKGGAKIGGTGLGLAIVREIMHGHRGRAAVTSTLGAGTTFSLHLPRAQADPSPDPAPLV